jgi:hypothetical protein
MKKEHGVFVMARIIAERTNCIINAAIFICTMHSQMQYF